MYTPRNRISQKQAVALIIVALIFDILSLIPVVNWIVWILNWLTFPLWFKLHGVSYIHGKRLALAGLSSIIEIIPFLSILPGYTVSMILMVRNVRHEDKIFNTTQAKLNQQQTQQESEDRYREEYQLYMQQKAEDQEMYRTQSERYTQTDNSNNRNTRDNAQRIQLNSRVGQSVNKRKA
ncbi:hypothetical protein H0W32_03330 [Patescibacteria group bacterium]|nr:hypothetical protein [Patescibacteria group bacterium]